MSALPLVVSFVGSSGVGKTTVIEQLIPMVRARGFRVGTVKHASHGHDVDRVGSDSWRHRQAGAETVLLVGASGAVVFLAEPADAGADGAHHHSAGEDARIERIVELVQTHLATVDVVLAEGFAPMHDRLVIVHRDGVASKAPAGPRQVWLSITDDPRAGQDEYGFDELEAVATRIVEVARTVGPLDTTAGGDGT